MSRAHTGRCMHEANTLRVPCCLHRPLMQRARLLSRPVRLPLCFQAFRPSDRHAGCAQLPPLRAVSAKLLSVRAMSTTAAPPQTKTHKSKKGDKKKDDSPYKDTVNLPQTSFNMRANSVQREPQIQKFWQDNKVYESCLQGETKETYVLHDGPPYANGDLHIGHALNKVLKDFILKYELLQGKRARYVPGWDCHGLPIELKVLQAMTDEQRRDLNTIKLRRKARDFALKAVNQQRQGFKRYGIWGDWDDPYLTLNPAYEAAQLKVFAKMVLNGHIYRGRKPVHWSPSSQTALAESELEYPEGHVSPSIYVALPIEQTGDQVPPELQKTCLDAALAIWTTTPWTMPANAAVAVNEKLLYSIVQAEGEVASSWNNKRLVVAHDLIDRLSEKLGLPLTALASLTGAQLAGCQYRHPLFERTSPVVIGGDYITTESGTGLVHTAPGHGQEDYQVGLKYGLPVLSPVDDAGIFTEEAGRFQGLQVQGKGNDAIIEALTEAGALLKQERYPHKYPYDWRTKQPTIFRATDQWFASVVGFRDEALAAIKDVRWVPASGQNRIRTMTEGRADWCISRQRKWGLPIPVFYYKTSGAALMTEETIEHITGVIAAKGSDAWYQMPVEELLPDRLKHEADLLDKGQDTMDVWFDSGSSWAGVLSREGLTLPADLYLEGSDQHRGWFQSSLLTCVAATGAAPYKTVLTHGFVLDEKGVKMSKSIGNVVDPRMVIEGGKNAKEQPAYGADVLRLWVASVDYNSDVLIGNRIISQVSDVYRKIRLTMRFLLGNLHDFDPAQQAVPYSQLPLTDRYLLSRFASLLADAQTSYSQFQFSRVYQSLQRFMVTDLSNFYLDITKDRLYVRATASFDRRACQTVLASLLQGMLPCVAPLLPHLAEDAWEHLPWPAPTKSVFQAGWFQTPQEWSSLSQVDQQTGDSLLSLRNQVNVVLEQARNKKLLGSALEAKVLLHVADVDQADSLRSLNAAANGADPLRYAFITSQAQLVDSQHEAEQSDFSATVQLEQLGQVTVGITRADGLKCARCWNYSTHVGEHSKHSDLCERCTPVIDQTGFVPAPKGVTDLN
ncbi:hypothetical protein ABBQ32_011301 [Trebouxia sp. C0010 RCD-2024]